MIAKAKKKEKKHHKTNITHFTRKYLHLMTYNIWTYIVQVKLIKYNKLSKSYV